MVLIPIPTIGINGAAIASVAGQAVMALIMFVATKKALDLELKVGKYLLKPIFATLVMAIVAYFSYNGIYSLINSNAIATLVSMLLAVTVFLACTLFLKVFTKEELELIPMGKKAVTVLSRFKIY